jgi:hypothetical protein
MAIFFYYHLKLIFPHSYLEALVGVPRLNSVQNKENCPRNMNPSSPRPRAHVSCKGKLPSFEYVLVIESYKYTKQSLHLEIKYHSLHWKIRLANHWRNWKIGL